MVQERKEPVVQEQLLVEEAFEARKMAYAPYSDFLVGAALLGASGKIWRGCNVENASFGATVCAERTALCKAVSEGERQFLALAVAGARRGQTAGEACFPCGICRQMLLELCGAQMPVIVAASPTVWRTYSLEELLPHAFGAANWKE